jgi:hypothetical protein
MPRPAAGSCAAFRWAVLILGLATGAPGTEPAGVPVVALPELGTATVARVGGFDVPYDWFLHEFRSSFFRHAAATNLREGAFAPFLERMTLYALARAAGVPDDPAVHRRIQEKIGGMRAFMEYQLALAEVGLVSDAYLESQGITPAGVAVTDEDLDTFFRANIQGQPGAPATRADLPENLQARLRDTVAAEKYGRLVSEKIAAWKTNLAVMVNHPLVDSVPLPEMENAPPEFRNLGESKN